MGEFGPSPQTWRVLKRYAFCTICTKSRRGCIAGLSGHFRRFGCNAEIAPDCLYFVFMLKLSRYEFYFTQILLEYLSEKTCRSIKFLWKQNGTLCRFVMTHKAGATPKIHISIHFMVLFSRHMRSGMNWMRPGRTFSRAFKLQILAYCNLFYSANTGVNVKHEAFTQLNLLKTGGVECFIQLMQESTSKHVSYVSAP